jgi:aryl-alcohol dehydrogenase-like predicted oxidoreductase
MQYRTLGRTGLKVSEIGFGGAQIGIPNYMETWDPHGAGEQQTIIDAVHHALDLGLNYIDTAPGYGGGISEEVLGRALAGRRDECVLATKLSEYDGESVMKSAEESLRRLRTDRLDVLQFHGGIYEQEALEAIFDGGGLEALRTLREQGKIRFLGFTAELPSGGVSSLIATDAFDVMQVRYNFMYQCTCDFVDSRGVMREAEGHRMGIVVMRPMTSGIFQRLLPQVFPQLAGADLPGFLLNYVLSNPFVDVAIVGMRRREEVEANNALSDDTSARLDLETIHDRFFPQEAS